MRWIHSNITSLILTATLPSLVAASAAAQDLRPEHPVAGMARGPVATVESWIRLPVAPGHERFATDRIQAADAGWIRDALGNLVKVRGTGAPVRVVACGLDAPAYVVSQIRDDGYVRVQLDGRGPRRPLWDQFNEGQRVLVMTDNRATPGRVAMVPGVFGVRSTHLWRGRVPHDGPTTIDDLWLDVGARNAADVAEMGIQLLDPVFRDLVPWEVAGEAVGPEAGARAGCAAVAAVAAVAASSGAPATGTTVFVISAQSAFNYTGLLGVLAHWKGIDSVWIVGATLRGTDSSGAGVRQAPVRLAFPAAMKPVPVVGIAPVVNDANTLNARLDGPAIIALREATARAAGSASANHWVTPNDTLPIVAGPRDSLSAYADLLARLTNRYAVSGHEAPVRDLIRAELPGWARPLAIEDTAGNLYVAVGPDRDTVVIVAHMDEVGFTVAGIEAGGRVELRPAGGFFAWLFEGQPALLHGDSDEPGPVGLHDCAASSASSIRGVFEVPATTPGGHGGSAGPVGGRAGPHPVYAWFGADPAALGIRPGMTVTGYKCATRLGKTRFTARSIDDRAGDTALLFAMRLVDPARLDHKVIFAFSTREEIGLEGAAALAAEFGVSVRRVLAVDTFVSSDSPVDSPRFADTPIGDGAVARMLDNSSVTPPEEFARVVHIAATQHIPLQWGTTNGGNDGSAFTKFGVPDVPIGWPLRYSHSPAEVIDLRDVRSLSRLVAAMALAPTR